MSEAGRSSSSRRIDVAARACVICGRRSTLGDADQSRAQQAVVDLIAGLQHLNDRAGGLAGIRHFEHRLMEVAVEALAFRPDALDLLLAECRFELPLRRGD